ncbi:BA75_01534T0 [Komagataella pastoris]|uniref:BA75_01534T0 n=1 Tax=Komagataella pastoris TaxID=4922 RepID=A0A1B2J9W5_PICPA|nr:BA75_01534T0 [Komagataella pastoris]
MSTLSNLLSQLKGEGGGGSTGQNQPRTVDPAVARLKAERKMEREKQALKEAQHAREARERRRVSHATQIGLKSTSRTPKSNPQRPPLSTSRSRPTPPPSARQRIETKSSKPTKPLNFGDLMKKAETIDSSQFAIANKVVVTPKKSNEVSRKRIVRSQPQESLEVSQRSSRNPAQLQQEGNIQTSRGSSKQTSTKGIQKSLKDNNARRSKPPAAIVPPPIAKPSAKLAAKLAARKKKNETRAQRHSSDVESDLDGFIDDDEDDENQYNDQGYDRNEIWSLFNRNGKRRYDYDDESDDMEANLEDIEREERMALKTAVLEDKRELEREQRLKREKLQRLNQLKK